MPESLVFDRSKAMSFSEDVKTELSKKINMARHCTLAFLSAAVLFSEKFIKNNEGHPVFLAGVKSEMRCIYFTLIRKVLNISFCDVLSVLTQKDYEKLLELVGLKEGEDGRFNLSNDIILMQPCCRKAFLKSAFLSSGSVSDPGRSYHLEIVSRDEEAADILIDIFRGFSLGAKKVLRKEKTVVYLKEAEDIASTLALMGADSSYLLFESRRVAKEMNGNINRRVNCETANIEKTVNASVKQVSAIRRIESTKGLSSLPKSLIEIAELRLLHPELSLEELGKMCTPPLGKSGVNHRLRRLVEIAETIEE